MQNPSRGAKRLCEQCGASFYDLARSPIVCPKCQAVFVPPEPPPPRPPRPARTFGGPKRSYPVEPRGEETRERAADEGEADRREEAGSDAAGEEADAAS